MTDEKNLENEVKELKQDIKDLRGKVSRVEALAQWLKRQVDKLLEWWERKGEGGDDEQST